MRGRPETIIDLCVLQQQKKSFNYKNGQKFEIPRNLTMERILNKIRLMPFTTKDKKVSVIKMIRKIENQKTLRGDDQKETGLDWCVLKHKTKSVYAPLHCCPS